MDAVSIFILWLMMVGEFVFGVFLMVSIGEALLRWREHRIRARRRR